ncbi:MAG: polysaccharide deacetylase family protein [Gaiellaceae bacterium]
MLVLAYHALTPDWQHSLAMRPETFRAQLHRLAERGFRGVTFTAAATGAVDGRVVVVTFDDGFRSAGEWAVQYLEELDWPATVFAVTRAATSGEPMRWLVPQAGDARDRDLLPMGWSELRDLAGRGWEIGSHTVTHRLLSRLDDSELNEELAASRRETAERIGACTSISYPWGEIDDRVVAAARAAGYVAGSGLAGRFRSNDPMTVPRVAVAGSDDGFRFGLKTSAFFWGVRSTAVWTGLDRLRQASAGPS